METGIDFAVGAGGRLGGAIGYESSSLTDIYGGKANEDIVRLSLYGSQTWGPLGFSGVLSYAHGWADSHRAAGIGLSSASRGDDALVGAAQVSAPWSIGSIVVTPAAGVTVSNTGSATFVEQNGTNAAFAVTGTVASQTVVSPYAVVGLSSAFTTAKGATITPDLQIGYRHASEGGAPVTLTAADSTVFTGNQINPEPDSALVGASITAHRDNWTAFVKYRGSFAGDWSSETVSAGLRISF
jgi:outer membrane autotransporter protein